MSSPRRIGTLLASVALAVPLSVLIGGAAFADPGNGSGKGSAEAPGQQGPAADHSKAGDKGPDHSSGNSGTSGDASQPQPPSNADFSGHGANQHGAYDSTRDGSPSENGNGGGKSVGKPCAGCVGKADNKNPPGQAPDGTDRNAGYECDRNKGVGRGNPAHTSCRAGEEPPGEEPPGKQPPGKQPPGQEPPGKQPPGEQPPGAQPGDQPGQGGGGLPVTGSAISGMLGLAVALFGLGAALRVAARRRAG